MTPYEIDQIVTIPHPDTVVAMACPGRCEIVRIAAYRLDEEAGAVSLDFYNRSFRSDDVKIDQIIPEPYGFVKFVLRGRLPVTVGDPVNVHDTLNDLRYDTSISEDPGVIRVSKIEEDGKVVTLDMPYDFGSLRSRWVNEDAGQIRLEIAGAERNLYRATQTLVGSGFAESWNRVTYVNKDPLGNLNIGVNRKIYIKAADAGTYRILIRTEESIGTGT